MNTFGSWLRALPALMAGWLLSACVVSPQATQANAPKAPPAGVSRDIVTASDESDARKRAKVRLELAAAYFGRGQLTTALDQVKLAIQADPSMGEAFNMRGLIYASLNDHRLAEESFTRAIELNPRDTDAMHNYGWFLCQQKRYADANRQYAKVLELVSLPGSTRTLLAQGVCHAFAGELPAARRVLARGYEIDPGNPALAVNYAEVLYRLGQYDLARTIITRVNNMADVVSAQTLWLAARIERRTGNGEALQEIGRQLRTRFPEARETAAFREGRFDD